MNIEWIVNNIKPPKDSNLFGITIPVLISFKNGDIPPGFYYYDFEATYDPDSDSWLGRWVEQNSDYMNYYPDEDIAAWAIIPKNRYKEAY